MTKIYQLLSLLVFMTAGFSMYPAVVEVNVDVDIIVQSCGSGSVCSIVKGGRTGAIGDIVRLDVTKKPVEALKPITKEDTKIAFKMPKLGEATIYSLTPTEGELKGERIYLAFNNVKQREIGRLAGKTYIQVLRQLEGDEPTRWIEVGSFTMGPAAALKVTQIPLYGDPDGTFILRNFRGEPKVEFLLGNKEVTSQDIQEPIERAPKRQKLTQGE